ncbi:hypothetical protein [Pseudalkalibacillus sp. SCS-8]|uniref:hypothetical protein n=1 Tax=Pseudalkalibacillus nanhaiensis TaxID=3115291 RepID=UPI0032DA32D3
MTTEGALIFMFYSLLVMSALSLIMLVLRAITKKGLKDQMTGQIVFINVLMWAFYLIMKYIVV